MSSRTSAITLSTLSVMLTAVGSASAGGHTAASVFAASGTDAGAISATVEAFRDELGQLNAPNPGTNCEGRRQINWDAAPDAISAPNAFPGDFFNFNAFPRARGVEFTTPGTGFQLSATAASGAGIEFDNITPGLSDLFGTFSPERLFTPLGSTVTHVGFFIPGSDDDATSRGFGVVFTDVDVQGSASIELFDQWGGLLGYYEAPAGVGDESLSFIGVSYDDAVVASVTIYSGNTPVDGASLEGEPGDDIVVMDDFIFGEPVNLNACGPDCPADVTGDGILDLADLSVFVIAFSSQDFAADLNNDGVLDLGDIGIFAAAYIDGCPG